MVRCHSFAVVERALFVASRSSRLTFLPFPPLASSFPLLSLLLLLATTSPHFFDPTPHPPSLHKSSQSPNRKRNPTSLLLGPFHPLRLHTSLRQRPVLPFLDLRIHSLLRRCRRDWKNGQHRLGIRREERRGLPLRLPEDRDADSVRVCPRFGLR